jgi:hypothetical protein
MTLTRKAALTLPSTQKATHPFKSTGSKSAPALVGVQPKTGRILRLQLNCQSPSPKHAALAATGGNGQNPAANADAMRRKP